MRLSLGRALALRPDLLLLDEPLAAVDELTRDLLQEELSALWIQSGFTGMLVTHNVHEAVFLSNRVIVMSPRPGRILDVIDVPFAFPRAPGCARPIRGADRRVTAALRHLRPERDAPDAGIRRTPPLRPRAPPACGCDAGRPARSLARGAGRPRRPAGLVRC